MTINKRIIKVPKLQNKTLVLMFQALQQNQGPHKLELSKLTLNPLWHATPWPHKWTLTSVTSFIFILKALWGLWKAFEWRWMDLPVHLYCHPFHSWSGLSVVEVGPHLWKASGHSARWTLKGTKYININPNTLVHNIPVVIQWNLRLLLLKIGTCNSFIMPRGATMGLRRLL